MTGAQTAPGPLQPSAPPHMLWIDLLGTYHVVLCSGATYHIQRCYILIVLAPSMCVLFADAIDLCLCSFEVTVLAPSIRVPLFFATSTYLCSCSFILPAPCVRELYFVVCGYEDIKNEQTTSYQVVMLGIEVPRKLYEDSLRHVEELCGMWHVRTGWAVHYKEAKVKPSFKYFVSCIAWKPPFVSCFLLRHPNISMYLFRGFLRNRSTRCKVTGQKRDHVFFWI